MKIRILFISLFFFLSSLNLLYAFDPARLKATEDYMAVDQVQLNEKDFADSENVQVSNSEINLSISISGPAQKVSIGNITGSDIANKVNIRQIDSLDDKQIGIKVRRESNTISLDNKGIQIGD